MSIARKYSLYAVQLADTVPVLISGLTTQGLQTGSQVDQEATSGEIYARFHALTAQNPTGRFATYHLATALAEIGLAGRSIAGLANGLNIYMQKHAEGGTRAGTLSHRKYNFSKGLIVPRTLTCSYGPNQHASISYEVIATHDGTNDPFTITESQTLPTAEADDERFALGPMTVGGVAIPQMRQFEIDFGLNAVAEGGGGERVDIWPTYVSIETIMSRITLRGIDPEWLKSTNIPLAGKAATHANSIMYLRKRADGGTLVADNLAQHMKFTAAGLAFIDDAFDATGSGAAESSLVLPLRYDGVNAPLTINTASTIV